MEDIKTRLEKVIEVLSQIKKQEASEFTTEEMLELAGLTYDLLNQVRPLVKELTAVSRDIGNKALHIRDIVNEFIHALTTKHYPVDIIFQGLTEFYEAQKNIVVRYTEWQEYLKNVYDFLLEAARLIKETGEQWSTLCELAGSVDKGSEDSKTSKAEEEFCLRVEGLCKDTIAMIEQVQAGLLHLVDNIGAFIKENVEILETMEKIISLTKPQHKGG